MVCCMRSRVFAILRLLRMLTCRDVSSRGPVTDSRHGHAFCGAAAREPRCAHAKRWVGGLVRGVQTCREGGRSRCTCRWCSGEYTYGAGLEGERDDARARQDNVDVVAESVEERHEGGRCHTWRWPAIRSRRARVALAIARSRARSRPTLPYKPPEGIPTTCCASQPSVPPAMPVTVRPEAL